MYMSWVLQSFLGFFWTAFILIGLISNQTFLVIILALLFIVIVRAFYFQRESEKEKRRIEELRKQKELARACK